MNNHFFLKFFKKRLKSEILANKGLRERYHSNLSACGIIDRNEWDRPLPKKNGKKIRNFFLNLYLYGQNRISKFG
ncbi:hypothetical protein BET09_04960 [Pediococcus acidilactici]|nr:hypothetical protein BET09_04960 [Pediococcus acidilactici]